MKKLFSPMQLRILLVANLLVIALVGVHLAVRGGWLDIASVGSDAYVHNRVRAPSLATNPSLSWTQSIGGSDDETALAVFGTTDQIHIFGNSASADFDFDNPGGYMATISADGTTQSVRSFAERLHSVTRGDSAYLAMFVNDKDNIIVRSLDYDGTVVAEWESGFQRIERPLDLIWLERGHYLAIFEVVLPSLGINEIHVAGLGGTLNLTAYTKVSNDYLLTYRDCWQIGDTTILLTDIATQTASAVFWTFALGATPQPHLLMTDFGYSVLDAAPQNGEWTLVIRTTQNKIRLLVVTADYRVKTLLYLEREGSYARLVPSTTAGGLLVHLRDFMCYYHPDRPTEVTEVPQLSVYQRVTDLALMDNSLMLVGESEGRTLLTTMTGTVVTTRAFGTSGRQTDPMLFRSGAQLSIICRSSAGDQDAPPRNFGGTDVVLMRLGSWL